MKEKIFIYLPDPDLSKPRWVLMDGAGNISTIEGLDDENLVHFKELIANKEIVVIVPGADVSLFLIDLPPMSHSRLREALPYALEDKLVDDPSKLHFAIGNRTPSGGVPVAVVANEKMQHWLKLLQSWFIQADFLLPDTLALPVDSEAWHLFQDDMVIVRQNVHQGFACDKNNVAILVQTALADSEQRPAFIYVHHYGDQPSLTLGVQVKEAFYPEEEKLAHLAKNLCHFSFMNLLQGQFAVKKNPFSRKEQWGAPLVYLAAAFFILLFSYPTLSYFMLKPHLAMIEYQIKTIYQREFPKASSVIAPKLRMQEKYQNLVSSGHNDRFISILAEVAAGIKKTPNVKLKQFSFQNNQLTLEVSTASSEDFTVFANFLMQEGFPIKNQTATLSDGHINTVITLT